MTEHQELNEKQREALGKCYELLIKWGREAEEAPRNAAYEGMTYEERGIAVYKKWRDGELHLADMTQLEWDSWVAEFRKEGQRTDNFLWNCENHRHLLRRVRSLWKKLTVDERQALDDLLESREWGPSEVEQAKEIVETAEWFSKLEGQ